MMRHVLISGLTLMLREVMWRLSSVLWWRWRFKGIVAFSFEWAFVFVELGCAVLRERAWHSFVRISTSSRRNSSLILGIILALRTQQLKLMKSMEILHLEGLIDLRWTPRRALSSRRCSFSNWLTTCHCWIQLIKLVLELKILNRYLSIYTRCSVHSLNSSITSFDLCLPWRRIAVTIYRLCIVRLSTILWNLLRLLTVLVALVWLLMPSAFLRPRRIVVEFLSTIG